MELSLEQKTYNQCEKTASLTLRQPLETDLVLPDYCGDIKRILHCTVEPNLFSSTVSGERVGAEGDLYIRLIYVNEDDAIDCAEQRIPLSVSGIVKKVSVGAVLQTRASMEYVNCRAVSPRKINVSGTALVHIDVLESKEEFYSGVSPSLETQTRDISVSVLRALCEKSFDLSETLALGDNRPAVGKLLRVTGLPLLQAVEKVDDKLLLKGSLSVELLYLSVDGGLFRLTHELPISQIIEAPGVKANGDVDVALQLQALQAEPKRDGNDEVRLIELLAKLSALVKSYNEETMTVVTDCYATQGLLRPTFSERVFPQRVAALHLVKSVQQSVDTDLKDGTLLDVSVLQTNSDVHGGGGRLIIQCQTTMSLLLQDADGEVQYVERTCEVQLDETLDSDAKDILCSPSISVKIAQSALDPNGLVRLQLDVSAEGAVFAEQSLLVLTDASLEDSSSDDAQSLVLSFSKQGDALWDIAKRYRTKLSLIQEENAIQGDVLQEDRMLLIPCAG